MKTFLTALAIAGIAGPALAGGCSGWGHATNASMAKAEPTVEAPAQSVAPDFLVATVSCDTLEGDAKAACLSASVAK